jgi:hypothetical protein
MYKVRVERPSHQRDEPTFMRDGNADEFEVKRLFPIGREHTRPNVGERVYIEGKLRQMVERQGDVRRRRVFLLEQRFEPMAKAHPMGVETSASFEDVDTLTTTDMEGITSLEDSFVEPQEEQLSSLVEEKPSFEDYPIKE